MMVSDPNLIHYACIAQGTTILAEFNSRNADADLGSLAAKCLHYVPPYHSYHTHTVRSKTYTFLISDPFVYFLIAHESLEKPEDLAFLETVKNAFINIVYADTEKGFSNRRLDKLSSHCFQGEFSPVFYQLLAPSIEMEGLNMKSGPDRSDSLNSSRLTPLLQGNGGNTLKKKNKKRVFQEFCAIACGGGGKANSMSSKKVDSGGGDDENGMGLSREFSVAIPHKNVNLSGNGLFASGELSTKKSSKKQMKRYIWIAVSVDLAVCILLFAVWLCVCRGFQCVRD